MQSSRLKLVPTNDDLEISALVDLSARLGRDPMLVQASNGNTSIKLNGVLWIKGSGKWLANAGQEDLLVPLPLADVQDSVSNNQDIAPLYAGDQCLRPSIETAMHAVLRHRVVIHVHSVNAIAWAIRPDGNLHLKERLAGLNWKWIPYVSSGIPLAREIEKRTANAPETDVLILANHGIVICGNDCDEAEALLWEIERRLAITPRQSPPRDGATLATITRYSPWRFPECDSLHALGTDAVSRKILQAGILYPCQAIFLGATMPFLSHSAIVSSSYLHSHDAAKSQPFVVVAGSGVLVNEHVTNTELANLLGLMHVIQRTEASTPIRYLTLTEVRNVLNDHSHNYKTVAIRSERVSSPFPGC